MIQSSKFDQTLDAVEQLSPDEQAQLVDIVKRRLALRGRQRIVQEVAEAKKEYEAGLAKPLDIDEFMREIGS